jgi:Peptidase family M48
MRALRISSLALTLSAVPLTAAAQQPTTLTQVVDKVVAQEQAEVRLLRQYTPMVETYVQSFRPDKQLGAVPDGDDYFLGRAELAKGVELEPLIRGTGGKHKIFSTLGSFLSMDFLPSGFLQMIYPDTNGFDRQHYKFTYVRREFLGEVRCLVFDVDPLTKADKGRFIGRIWVEDQDYHIVRFNGAYSGSSMASYYFNFDSWRTNAGQNEWLPAVIYSEEGNVRTYFRGKFKPFKAQTRLWGYAVGDAKDQQELSRVFVEAPLPVKDQTDTANDYSPLQAQRSWGRQAEDNVAASMERMGLMAPRGDVDRVLATVVNNLEVSNNLDIQPEVRCRVLMTSTLESFTMGHTIVLSRGLVDVLPDEASLAVVLAHELGHIVLGHRMDTQFAFLNRLRFGETETFRHFGFGRTPEETQAANQKGIELLSKSPYKDQSEAAQLFLQALQSRSKDIPNLISAHLGDRVPTSLTVAYTQPSAAKPAANIIAGLPLGGRIKVDPWNDELRMLKSRPVGEVAEYEKMPFEVTPVFLYLTRQAGNASADAAGAASAKADTESKP